MKGRYIRGISLGTCIQQHPKQDRSPRLLIYTNIFQYGIIVTFLLVLAACGVSTPIETDTQTPVSLVTDTLAPTKINSPAPIPSSTPTLKPQDPFDRIILVEVGNDIWSISHPFQSAVSLFKEENVIFGVTVWSHDGEWIAYAKATTDCPVDSELAANPWNDHW
jgi:hypothetical protein